jgi:predicted amidohydrolase YtcJ
VSSPGPRHSCCTIPSSGHDASAHAAAPSQPRPNGRVGEPAVLFSAGAILTLDPLAPRAEAVAVQDGLVRSVGSRPEVVDELKAAGVDYRVDNSFGDHVLVPGFVEPHCHATQLGLLWSYTYVGNADRLGPDGRRHPGCPTVAAVVERLRGAAARLPDPAAPVVAWGYDPILIDGQPPLGCRELDEVSTSRPVFVLNMSGHIAYVNGAALRDIGYDRASGVTGLVKDGEGDPTGELQEAQAVRPTLKYFEADETGMHAAMANAGALAVLGGCTTITELAAGLMPHAFGSMQQAGSDPDYPARVTAYVFDAVMKEMGEAAFDELMATNHDHFRVAGVKFVVDGSIQGFTADLRFPGYYNGAPNGILNIDPDSFPEQVHGVHARGIQTAIHANGDGAIERAMAALAEVLRRTPWPDHRHRIEHVQMADDRQLGWMSELGVAPDLFANHIYYWGDAHAEKTVGPGRAARMNPAASALRHGLRFGFHSDSWVTPIEPLRTIWVAATRRTISGRELGPQERIGVTDALRALTLDAAYLLKEDDIKGSIERGKVADFAILDGEPRDDDLDAIPDIAVAGTLLGGVLHTPAVA